jgi:hypothetical protein
VLNLPLTIVPCHAPSERPLVLEMAEYLERGAPVKLCVEEAEIAPGQDLLARLTHAMQADVVFAMLSPESTLARWKLEKWTPVFRDLPESLGVHVATVLCRECAFPALLRRERFFDLTGDRLDTLRRIKQWLLGLRPPAQAMFFAPRQPDVPDREQQLEELRRRLGDRPGVAVITSPSPGFGKTTLAAQFARRYRADFEGVLWIPCADRSTARLAGALASQLGLRLEGPAENNVEELRRFLSQRRCLVVLDDVRSDAALPLIAGGRVSTLITTERSGLAAGARMELGVFPGGPIPPAPAPADLGALSELQDSFSEALTGPPDPESWSVACGLARRAVRLAREEGRLAEADEVLQTWFREAERRQDRRALEECAWERIWILEKWDRTEEARKLDSYRRIMCQDQMCFEFAGQE